MLNPPRLNVMPPKSPPLDDDGAVLYLLAGAGFA